jgi:hypothetical protein
MAGGSRTALANTLLAIPFEWRRAPGPSVAPEPAPAASASLSTLPVGYRTEKLSEAVRGR